MIQIITQYYGVYCENSMSPKYAHLWLFLADLLFIGGAFGATMAFYRRLAKEIGPTHKAKAKVISFVGIVAFQIIQGVSLYSSRSNAERNDKLTRRIVGLPPHERKTLQPKQESDLQRC